MTTERGKYIVIEGADGVGKTTQVRMLIHRLKTIGIDAIETHEPGGSPMSEKIREVLASETPRSSFTDVLLFNASRTETLSTIDAHLAQGKWVVSDRCFLSTVIYQGHGDGVDLEFVRTICDTAVRACFPDKIIIITISDDEARRRMRERGELDYQEKKGMHFQRAVSRGYELEAGIRDIPIVDGIGDLEDIHDCIWEYIKPLLL